MAWVGRRSTAGSHTQAELARTGRMHLQELCAGWLHLAGFVAEWRWPVGSADKICVVRGLLQCRLALKID